MNALTFRRLLALGSVLPAIWLGWTVANGELLLAGLLIAISGPLLASFAFGISADALVAGVVLFGYLVGNRGFAQLSAPGIPLFPGETALGIGIVFGVWRMARAKVLLTRRDALNVLLLFWITLCGLRLPFDLRTHGLVALRDFALVNYALFFFLAQSWHQNAKSRRYIEACVSGGFIIGTAVALAFLAWPEIFSRLTIFGVPVIFVKGDVASSFMAAGVFWFGSRYARTGVRLKVVLAAICAAAVLQSNSRAAIVALAVGGMGLLLLRELRILRAFAVVAALGLMVLLVEAAWPRDGGRPSHAFRLYDSVLTIADFAGVRTPVSADLGDKPANNQFRLVWWQAVIDQTRDEGLWFGLGFGRDLAEQFVRRYYADNSDEFNTRSPHNFLITVFARTGVVGLLAFLALLAAAIRQTFRAAQAEIDVGNGSQWLAPWMILITSCFGVILEGPMGAAVFWTLLGLANASSRDSSSPLGDSDAGEADDAASVDTVAAPAGAASS